ncbi:MAG TPA: PIN domain-containing protein [Rubrivivax sp.]
MILVDTSVWVDHLRTGDAQLAELLERGAVLTHPYVLGEIACGILRDRAAILELLQDLPTAVTADAHEVMQFIERHSLHRKGIGYVDVHLMASVALTSGASLWTRDKRLATSAQALHCAFLDHAAH